MSRINTNVPSLIVQRVLGQNNKSLDTSLQRLSTGLRINSGKDDPAGLIASENLRSEIAGISAAIGNAERADQVVNIAEGGLTEVSNLLVQLQGLVTSTANDAGLSLEERQANQLQIDSILQTIDRIAGATSLQGSKLLNGNFDYQTTNVADDVVAFRVNGAKLNFNEQRDVSVLVTQSAQVAGFFLSFGADNLNLGGAAGDDGADEDFIIEITGSKGSRELAFSSGTELTTIAATINSFTSVTGVRATVSGTTGLRLASVEHGSDEFVSVKVVDDGAISPGANGGIYRLQDGNANASQTTVDTTFANADNKISDSGQDVEGTINGIRATTRGRTIAINTDFLDVEIKLSYDTASTAANAAVLGALDAFTITGGGADFQLAPDVNISGRVSLGLQNIAARNLGRSEVLVNGSTSTYFLSDMSNGNALNMVDGNLDAAQEVISEAIKEVSELRGRIGAFQQNVIGATINSLGIALENTTAAESVIRDADFAEESAGLTRSQILVQSATNVLAIANTQPQNALSLLG